MGKPTSENQPTRELPVDLSAGSPREVWDAYFRGGERKPSVVGEAIQELFERGEYEQVIAAIQAALIHGQSQPWMYEVLALTMEIAGRPKAEIERVLLSTVDFTAVDVPSMMYSATMLTRFGRDARALQLYRQSSRLAPTRSEPYLLGLKLAQKLQDVDAVEWAVAGILKHAWTGDFQRQHREAENAALDIQQILIREGKTERAEQLTRSLNQARKRDLSIRLVWSGEGNIDMSIEEPPGTACSRENPRTESGGYFLHDGQGPAQDNCHEDYVCPQAMPGYYLVRIKHVSGNIVGKRAQLTINRYQGGADAMERTLPVLFDKPEKVFRISLHQGRRRTPEAIPQGRLPIGDGPQVAAFHLRSRFVASDAQSRAAARDFYNSRRRILAAQLALGAVGFQPVVTVVSEGVSMNASAVVSADRRYVRISTSPTFSSLSDVLTFSFLSTGPTGTALNGAVPAGP